MLRFAEDACVQCGLCKATCPEKVITLRPQLDFRAARTPARVLKEEQPFCCIRCGKPFGVKSTIERVAAKLEGKHWMYKDTPRRLEVIKMCDDCRVAVVSEQDFDPYGSPPRAPPRTTDDYLRERQEAKRRRTTTERSLPRRLFQEFHQRGAVLRADALLRHLGAWRVGRWPDLEQLGDGLGRPHDLELLQGR